MLQAAFEGASMAEIEKKNGNVGIGALLGMAVFGLINMAIGLVALAVMYGVVVIVFRYAFHVELWNPFH
jgi:hypothetical protein